MTNHQPAHGPVRLDRVEAEDLVHLLGRIEDWLRHADPDTHTGLAAFLDGSGNGALAAAGLLHAIDQHTLLSHNMEHRSIYWEAKKAVPSVSAGHGLGCAARRCLSAARIWRRTW